MNRFRVIHGTVLLDIKFHKKMLFPNFVSDIINGCGLQEIRVMQRISVSNFRFWGPFPVHLLSTRTLIFNSHLWFATRTFDLQLVLFFFKFQLITRNVQFYYLKWATRNSHILTRNLQFYFLKYNLATRNSKLAACMLWTHFLILSNWL